MSFWTKNAVLFLIERNSRVELMNLIGLVLLKFAV